MAEFINIWDSLSYVMYNTLRRPWMVSLSAILLAAAYVLNMHFVLHQRYPENQPFAQRKNRPLKQEAGFRWFRNPHLHIEWLLLTRNPVFRNQGLLSLLILGLLLFVSYKIFVPPQAIPPANYAANYINIPVAQPGEYLLTILVEADTLPVSKTLTIVGDHDSLGLWKNMIPLATTDSVHWQRTFAFPKSKPVAFKITGGDWAYRAIDAGGKDLENNYVQAQNDTTVQYTLNHWSEKDEGNGLFYPFYMAVFITGILLMMYGQNILAFSATYYDALLTHNISLRDMLKAKRTIMQMISLTGFVVCIPYMVINHNQAAWIFLSLMAYHIGFNANLILLLSPFQRNGIDLNQKLNMRRNSPIQFVMTIGAFGLPLLIFYLLEMLVSAHAAFVAIFITGLISWMLQPCWLSLTYRLAVKNKYIQSDAFRKTNV